ncbi:GatB/YqeY domain-containing protein [Propionimicrobium lymphophilum]|uniref:GatB/YqeY domain-containing protein n=1 Tax=Propionimicrobium lymphophilum ACS-093-V-SCH5 TaxID=883161 RepID=S2WLF7_9ACTN|nr:MULTISPECIES: GatB/YqeY domain-containing protein [Propionimicrobium]EPD33492.1 hypothetical protein HMPREF9306_01033 [Propionimicrobium lymphophilum ACS-093-V-SCH5]ETJ98040.1 YqeY-like protein [Propionimicrobium sp. BV2F7]MDK7734705.1 GatB/YqeY domain-containing protein [Propionimicrobium lymphophilum]
MGTLKTQLKKDLTAAMKAKDELAKSTIRMALAAFLNAEVSGSGKHELSDAEELKILTKEVKAREESAQTYIDAGRPELAESETAEAEFLHRYLPKQLSEDELAKLVDEAVAAAEAELGEKPTMRQMGSIVKAVNEKAAGAADGKTVATMVRSRLS